MRRGKGGYLAIITQEDALHRVTASAPPQTELPLPAAVCRLPQHCLLQPAVSAPRASLRGYLDPSRLTTTRKGT